MEHLDRNDLRRWLTGDQRLLRLFRRSRGTDFSITPQTARDLAAPASHRALAHVKETGLRDRLQASE
jgi:hypothetical protein